MLLLGRALHGIRSLVWEPRALERNLKHLGFLQTSENPVCPSQFRSRTQISCMVSGRGTVLNEHFIFNLHKSQVDKSHPLYTEYYPLDIEYRLFKAYWKWIDAIFTCYDEYGLQKLMEYRIENPSNDRFIVYDGRGGSIKCWVTSERRGSPHIFTNFLAERRLQQAKKSDSARFIAGHAMVVERCLHILLAGHFGISDPTV